ASSSSGWCARLISGGPGAAGPSESAGVGDLGLNQALALQRVVRSAAEEQTIRVGVSTGSPRRVVVNFAMIARLKTIGARSSAVAGAADDALVGRRDAFGAAEVQGPVGVILEHGQVMNRVGGHANQVAHRQCGIAAVTRGW